MISLTTATGFSSDQSDGLMGIGFPSICNGGQTGYFFNLIKQQPDCTQEFGFYLGRSLSNTADKSEMILCGRDTSKINGTVTNVNVTKQGYWQVALDGLTVDDSPDLLLDLLTSGQAAIDTGTTIILAPTVNALLFFSSIGGFPIPLISGSASLTIFAYPCQSTKKVGIKFAGKDFAINPLDFNFGQLTDDMVKEIFHDLGLDNIFT